MQGGANSPESKPKPKVKRGFTPPTLEEVRDYCLKRKNSVNPERFYSHYEMVGWRVGKNMMKNWKAAVVKWESCEYRGRDPDDRHGGFDGKDYGVGGAL